MKKKNSKDSKKSNSKTKKKWTAPKLVILSEYKSSDTHFPIHAQYGGSGSHGNFGGTIPTHWLECQ